LQIQQQQDDDSNNSGNKDDDDDDNDDNSMTTMGMTPKVMVTRMAKVMTVTAYWIYGGNDNAHDDAKYE
jgi:hypothetical protein